MTRKAKRLYSIGAILLVIGAAAGLVLSALSDSVAYFNSPTDIVTKSPAPGQRIRLGGLVADGSVVRGGSDQVTFKVTDSVETVPVTYKGILPDLFREGRASSPKERSAPTTSSSPTPCSPSTTRITCRRRSSTI